MVNKPVLFRSVPVREKVESNSTFWTERNGIYKSNKRIISGLANHILLFVSVRSVPVPADGKMSGNPPLVSRRFGYINFFFIAFIFTLHVITYCFEICRPSPVNFDPPFINFFKCAGPPVYFDPLYPAMIQSELFCNSQHFSYETFNQQKISNYIKCCFISCHFNLIKRLRQPNCNYTKTSPVSSTSQRWMETEFENISHLKSLKHNQPAGGVLENSCSSLCLVEFQ